MRPDLQLTAGTDGECFETPLSVQRHGIEIYWDGFVYTDTSLAQTPTVEKLVEDLRQNVDLKESILALKGCFFMLVKMPARNTTYAFIDNSGAYSAFRSDRAVAASFVRLFRRMDLSASDLSRAAMLSLLQVGNVYFGNTLSEGIKRISFDELVIIQPDGLSVEPKGAPLITDPPVHADLFSATKGLAEALADSKVSVDITGGFDSRLIAVLLHHHDVDFELALSGTLGQEDQVLGEEVARALGRSYHFTEYDDRSLGDDLDELCERADYLGGDIFSLHRLLQLQEDRRARGVDVAVKGVGGELYKDFFWRQDFPFYRKKQHSVQKLARLRIELERLPTAILGESYAAISDEVRDEWLSTLSRYKLEYNTQTADNIYFRERIQSWSSSIYTSTELNGCYILNPLCEVECTQVGFHEKRMKRFYSRLHREVITHAHPAVSRIMTTNGVTASSKSFDLLADSWGFFRHESRALAVKLGQVFLNRTLKSGPSTSGARTDLLSNTAAGRQALESLKREGVVADEIDWQRIPERFQGRFLAIGSFLHRLS
jgi:hypothetical protein